MAMPRSTCCRSALRKSDVLAHGQRAQVPGRSSSGAGRIAVDPDTSYTSVTGLTNADLERYLADGPDGVAPAVALRIERLMRASERRGAAPLTMVAE